MITKEQYKALKRNDRIKNREGMIMSVWQVGLSRGWIEISGASGKGAKVDRYYLNRYGYTICAKRVKQAVQQKKKPEELKPALRVNPSRSKLYTYVIIWHSKDSESQVMVGPAYLFAKNYDNAMMLASMELPHRMRDYLDQIEVLVRPF